MEQHLMWMKSSKQIFKETPILLGSFNVNNTWEEETEDSLSSASPFGGFVWPPRSYSCTFCRREFKSAQALGGHMNVHRRDRARLKQYSLNLQQSRSTPHDLKVGNFSSVSSKVTQENYSGCQSLQVSPPPSLVGGGRKSYTRKELPRVTLDHDDIDQQEPRTTVETNLTMGIHDLRDSYNNNVAEMAMDSKRYKKSSGISSFGFLHKPCSSNRYMLQTNSLEDIDLELRLGAR